MLISRVAVPIFFPTNTEGVSLFLQPLLYLLSVVLILAILTGLRCNLKVLLICIPLSKGINTKDAKDLS